MFSGRYPLQKDKDNNYFIDRDGSHFSHILNYLRDDDCMPPPEVAPEVMKEAIFYGVGDLEKRLKLYSCLFVDYVIWEPVRKNIDNYYRVREHLVAIACQVHVDRGVVPPSRALLEIVFEEDVTFQNYEKKYKSCLQRNPLVFKHYVSVKAKTYDHALNIHGCFMHDLSKDGYKFTIEALHPSYLDPDTDQYTHKPLMIFNIINMVYTFQWQ